MDGNTVNNYLWTITILIIISLRNVLYEAIKQCFDKDSLQKGRLNWKYSKSLK